MWSPGNQQKQWSNQISIAPRFALYLVGRICCIMSCWNRARRSQRTYTKYNWSIYKERSPKGHQTWNNDFVFENFRGLSSYTKNNSVFMHFWIIFRSRITMRNSTFLRNANIVPFNIELNFNVPRSHNRGIYSVILVVAVTLFIFIWHSFDVHRGIILMVLPASR